MTHRTALSAVLAAVLAIPAAGLADTLCDGLTTTNKLTVSPEKIGDALCNACVGLPVPGARDRNGNGLDYNDAPKHWECEFMVGNRGNGQCKKQTTCLAGGERFFDNGVYKCRYPAVVITGPGPSNPRDDCERGLRVSISRVKNIDGLPLTANVIRKPGPVGLLIEGDGAANGVSATIGGGISVSVGAIASRIGSTPRSYCLPPNCQVVDLANLGNAPTGNQTLTLYTPHHYASASVDLFIAAPAPTPSYSIVQQHSAIGGPGGPSVLPARGQVYYASLTCPGGSTPGSNTPQINSPSAVFEIRSAQVQATAFAHWKNTTVGGVSICGRNLLAYAFKIKNLDGPGGPGDVTIPWQPDPNGRNMDGTKTISLPRGHWQIFPDATFPPDFEYTISFTD
jgi:hypothetical protein